MNYPNATHYSEHFSHKELNCHCGCKTPAAVELNLTNLATNLERLRVLVGGPLSINDAYRCVSENKRVGGVMNSQHLFGKAADIDTGSLSNAAFAALAAKVPLFNLGGIGMYPSQHFVHVDYRSNGPARWDEND